MRLEQGVFPGSLACYGISLTDEREGFVKSATARARAPSRTGALRASIGVVDSEEGAFSSSVTIGAQVKYDLFYQAGTSRQPARPYTPQVAEVVDTAVAGIARTAFRTAVG